MKDNVHIQNLIWLDLEMTGLNPQHDRILEIATIVTDNKLNILAEGPVLAIYQRRDLLQDMDDWNTKHHTASGLVERVQQSQITEKKAEEETLDFIKKYVEPQTSPICGNSIYQDRRFLIRYMPTLAAYFHYRNLDVSTLKILAQIWRPELLKGLKKDSHHRALQDIRDSIEELKHYQKYFLNLS